MKKSNMDKYVLKKWKKDYDYVWSEKTNIFNDHEDFIDFLDGLNMCGYKPQFNVFDYEIIVIDSDLRHIVPLKKKRGWFIWKSKRKLSCFTVAKKFKKR